MTDPVQDAVSTVQKKTANPPGILPRHAQAWFIGGISVVMVLVIALSGGREPKDKKALPQASSAIDPSQARIQEYRARIDEQARKLAEEQSELAQTQKTLTANGALPVPPSSASGGPARLAYEGYAAPPPEKNWIELDKEKREYQSLFASNLALSYRQEARQADPVTTSLYAASPSHDDREDTGARPSADARASSVRAKERDAKINRAEGKDYRLFEGTVIESVLTNRLDGSFSGPVNCMVTTDIFSHDRQRLLIPQGSRILGEVRRVDTFGQERLAVAFHRLIMPDGFSVSLDQFQGLNQIGETGLRDQINHHYLQVFGVSLAIGAIAGLSQAGTKSGSDVSAEDAYRQGVATSLSQSSLRILDRYLNVLPTFTIREGHRVKVYLSDDLLLPAYEKHQMPGDL